MQLRSTAIIFYVLPEYTLLSTFRTDLSTEAIQLSQDNQERQVPLLVLLQSWC